MESSFIKSRDNKIDILKGIGIILMVVRHARAPYSDFVLLFHMALFFIASGYLMKSDSPEDVKSLFVYIKKKIKGLWKPYFLFTCFFVLCHNIFLRLNIYTDNPQYLECTFLEYPNLMTAYSIKHMLKVIVKAIFFQSGTQMGGALWFFYALFLVLIMYNVIGFLLRKITKTDLVYFIMQGIVSAVLLILGYICFLSNRQLHGLSRCFSVYCLIYIGYMIKNKKIMDKICYSKKKVICGIIVSFVILLLGYHRGNIAIDGNVIENPVFFLVMSMAGWNLVYLIAYALECCQFVGNRFLTYISEHSVWIIALHFLSFKLVSLFEIYFYGYEPYYLAAFPVLSGAGLWWLLYTIVGLVIPLGAEFICHKVCNFATVKSTLTDRKIKDNKKQ